MEKGAGVRGGGWQARVITQGWWWWAVLNNLEQLQPTAWADAHLGRLFRVAASQIFMSTAAAQAAGWKGGGLRGKALRQSDRKVIRGWLAETLVIITNVVTWLFWKVSKMRHASQLQSAVSLSLSPFPSLLLSCSLYLPQPWLAVPHY